MEREKERENEKRIGLVFSISSTRCLSLKTFQKKKLSSFSSVSTPPPRPPPRPPPPPTPSGASRPRPGPRPSTPRGSTRTTGTRPKNSSLPLSVRPRPSALFSFCCGLECWAGCSTWRSWCTGSLPCCCFPWRRQGPRGRRGSRRGSRGGRRRRREGRGGGRQRTGSGEAEELGVEAAGAKLPLLPTGTSSTSRWID